MARPVSSFRRLKYRVLSHLPGSAGQKYRRKLRKARAPQVRAAFAAAVEAAAGRIAVDLGANLGEFTRPMAARAAHVYAFEPDPWTAARLRENLAGLPNVTVIEAAAGVEDGTVSLYRSPAFGADPQVASQSASTLAAKRNVDASAAIEVPQVDFLRWAEALDADIALLKIDIEGAEVALLERLLASPLLPRIGHIFAETHETRIPELAARTEALRARARSIARPAIDLDWK